MAQNVGSPSEEESLKTLFDQAMLLFDETESGSAATNSDAVQMTTKAAIAKFEKATNLVSLSGMFSANEDLEELPTETLQYLLLPALLGALSLKLCGRPRKDIINVAEIYFMDFLQRCRDYGVTDEEPHSCSESGSRPQSEQAKIANMVLSRQAKIQRYKEQKELQQQLAALAAAARAPGADDAARREHARAQLRMYASRARDELDAIRQERPLLDYMEKNAAEAPAPAPRRAPAPLRPVTITRAALRQAVLGAGYPAQPALSVEEFYERRVRDGLFPSPGSVRIPHSTLQSADADPDEEQQIRQERLSEADDAEELARRRAFDDYKDTHRRGAGNRHNRS